MALSELLKIVKTSSLVDWTKKNREAFNSLFGSEKGRYMERARESVSLRAPEMRFEVGVPFAAYIHHSNPPSGAYTGTSFVVFPATDENHPCLIGLGVGT